MRKFFKFIIACLIFVSISTPVLAQNDVSYSKDETNMELIENDIKVNDSDIAPIDTENVKKTVVTDSHKESKKVIGLFLKTMVAVAFCSILLYFILVFVKKYYSGSFISQEAEELENLDLATPSTKQDAIRSFLNRTK